MYLIRLILKNAFRHRLRTLLTIFGLVVAIMAFGLLQTMVDAWYAGADSASASRLLTRNAVSLVFPLPLTYRQKLRTVPGVRAVSNSNWFGGIYKEPKNFFPQFAVDVSTYFKLYPEFIIPDDQFKAFVLDRQGAVIGRKLARDYGIKVGDTMTLKGTIFPGNWEFVVRGIYDGRDAGTDISQFFFHWEYLNETLLRTVPRRANTVGVYVLELTDPGRAAEVSLEVDKLFKNSIAETLTETEKAFQLSFVSMTEALVVAIRTVSFLVIIIIMAVTANTMAMTARERLAEYATLKALGFGPRFVMLLITGESLAIALIGGMVGIVLTFPVADTFSKSMSAPFSVFRVSEATLVAQIACALVVGAVAALFPSWRAARVNIVDGLRSIG
ncbi:MAG: FtsX-like permease family protein [Rhodocyclaceae bacterium]